MRYASGLLLLSVALIPLGAGWAQPTPSVDQVTRALSQPAPGGAAQPRFSATVTPAMLRGPTRGITLAGPAPVAVPASATNADTAPGQVAMISAVPPRTDADMCAAGSGTCALVVQFETGSAVLSPDAIATLEVLGKALTSPATAGYRFRIEGHTDTVGSRELNLALSDERAHAVAAYLEQHFAIPPARLQAAGVGKDRLLAATPDQTPDARNRRVQVINLGT
jgi:OOP family OmpA-OmpF porin